MALALSTMVVVHYGTTHPSGAPVIHYLSQRQVYEYPGTNREGLNWSYWGGHHTQCRRCLRQIRPVVLRQGRTSGRYFSVASHPVLAPPFLITGTRATRTGTSFSHQLPPPQLFLRVWVQKLDFRSLVDFVTPSPVLIRADILC